MWQTKWFVVFYIVPMFKEVVCDEEMSESLKLIDIFNGRDSVVGQIQKFKLPQRRQTLDFLYFVEWQI